MSEKTMVRQSFLPRFLPRKRLKIHKYCGSISFFSSPLWLKTSQIFRHMANIFAFGDVASGSANAEALSDLKQPILPTVTSPNFPMFIQLYLIIIYLDINYTELYIILISVVYRHNLYTFTAPNLIYRGYYYN